MHAILSISRASPYSVQAGPSMNPESLHGVAMTPRNQTAILNTRHGRGEAMAVYAFECHRATLQYATTAMVAL